MYVTQFTTQKEIKDEIKRVEKELNSCRTDEDRQVIREELDYLHSFIYVERW